MVLNWQRIGIVIQGSADRRRQFAGGADVYLEVESLLDDGGDPVQAVSQPIQDLMLFRGP
jgi:hypothetical protein